MKALVLKEPWLTLIINGEKPIETRTWSANYRGDILLTGSKSTGGKYAGKAACVVRLCHIRKMTPEDEFLARCKMYPGAKAWILDNVRLVKPFLVKGQMGLFEVPDELIEYIKEN